MAAPDPAGRCQGPSRAALEPAEGRAKLPGVERGQQFLPGGFGGGVVADLVQQVPGEMLSAGADGAAGAPGDQRHERREVPVLRRTGNPPARRRPCRMGAGSTRSFSMASSSCRQVRGPARFRPQTGPRPVWSTGGRSRPVLPGAQALTDQAAAPEADPDIDERDREGVGQVLEMVATSRPSRRRGSRKCTSSTTQSRTSQDKPRRRLGGRVPRRCPYRGPAGRRTGTASR